MTTVVEWYVAQIPQSLITWYDKLAAEKHCRACLREQTVRPLTRHHLVPQSWWLRRGVEFARFRNISANIIPLCRPCHDEVERDTEARRMLRRVLTQQEIALAIALRGQPWLDAVYPR
jgi:hypothetical protein